MEKVIGPKITQKTFGSAVKKIIFIVGSPSVQKNQDFPHRYHCFKGA